MGLIGATGRKQMKHTFLNHGFIVEYKVNMKKTVQHLTTSTNY